MNLKPVPPPQEKSVFEQVRKEREPAKKMTPEEIIQADLAQTGGDFNEVRTALNIGVQQGKIRLMRHGNTLLIYRILAPGEAEVHISTADKPKEVVKAAKEFFQAMLKAGFKKATTTSNNPQIAKMLSTAQIPVRVRQIPDASGQMTFELSFGA